MPKFQMSSGLYGPIFFQNQSAAGNVIPTNKTNKTLPADPKNENFRLSLTRRPENTQIYWCEQRSPGKKWDILVNYNVKMQ